MLGERGGQVKMETIINFKEACKKHGIKPTWSWYKKKPFSIRAIQINKDFMVKTLEGDHTATAGDYLLEGVRGELYPCKRDIFEDTYERVEK